jgi:replication fork clamp-binding protein CrfC
VHILQLAGLFELNTNNNIGREAVFLRDRIDVLKLRLMAIKSKQCATKKNKYHCPEVFLDAVADKLTTTADLFLDAELLSKFYYIVSYYLSLQLHKHR